MIRFLHLLRVCGDPTRMRPSSIWQRCCTRERMSDLLVAAAAAQAVERVGMPESQIILAQAVSYIASAPKSNAACLAIAAAMEAVKSTTTTVPVHLKDRHYKGAAKLGHGEGYLYAHDYPEHYVKQQYLPDEIIGKTFYHPTDIGYEKEIAERLKRLRDQ